MKHTKRRILNECKWLSMILPVLIIYCLIMIAPFISTVYYSFTNWDGITSSFIGLENFKNLLHDKMIRESFGNTALYAVSITLIQNFLGLFLAVLMTKKLFAQNALRTLFFLPNIFSALLLGYVWSFMLDPNSGIVNRLLELCGLESWQQDWLGDPFWGKIMIIALTIWQCIGYSMVIYIAGLQSISVDYYEVAEIEGANAFQSFRKITFPMVAPAFTINIILSLIGTMKIFDPIYALTNGGPGYSTNSVATMIYKLGFETKNEWGYGTAMSVVLFLFILLLTLIIVPRLRKREVEL